MDNVSFRQSIYRRVRLGQYAMVRFRLDPQTKIRFPLGPLEGISSEEMAQRGTQLVLEQVPWRATDPTRKGIELYLLTAAQRVRGETRPAGVAIWQESPDRLVLQPLKSGDKTNIFEKTERCESVALPIGNQPFLAILDRVLKQAE